MGEIKTMPVQEAKLLFNDEEISLEDLQVNMTLNLSCFYAQAKETQIELEKAKDKIASLQNQKNVLVMEKEASRSDLVYIEKAAKQTQETLRTEITRLTGEIRRLKIKLGPCQSHTIKVDIDDIKKNHNGIKGNRRTSDSGAGEGTPKKCPAEENEGKPEETGRPS